MLQSTGLKESDTTWLTEQQHYNTLVSECSGSPGAVLYPRKYLEISGDILLLQLGCLSSQGVAATVHRTASKCNKELFDPKYQ